MGVSRISCRGVGHFLIVAGALALTAVPAGAAQTGKAAYAPGVTMAGEVFLPDGVTPRTYSGSGGGQSLWTEGLPIQQGDTFTLDLFAATGPSELGTFKVRLDMTKIADLTSAPWNTVIDTSRLSPGYHMIELWAQTAGDRPQASTKTLSFYVTKDLPPQYLVKGIQQELQGGQQTTVTPGGPATGDPNAPPSAPQFLAGQPTDASAQVSLVCGPSSAQLAPIPGGGPLTISGPTYLAAQAAPGSTATHFAYVLARGGQTINSAAQPLGLAGTQSPRMDLIKLQKRTDSEPGLRPGLLTVWLWGIDAEGHPSAPAKIQISVQ